MFCNARRTIYRYVTAAVLVFVIAVPVVFSFGVQSAHAQAVTIVESIPEKTNQIIEEIGRGLYASALGGLVQGASYFMRKLAYDAATALSSGDKGQKPLAITENFGDYIKDTASDSVAEAISGFGTDFGLDLCQPLDLQLQAKIKIGLDRLYNVTQGNAPKPKCTWQELSKNWHGKGDATGSGVDSAEQFYNTLQIEQTDFGITLSLIGKLGRLKVEKEKKAEIESITGRGFKPVTDLISGKVKTPAAVIEEETKALTAKHQGELTAGQITGIYGAGSAQILPMAASVFLNVLTSNLLDKVVKDGLFPSDGGSKTGSQIAGSALDFYGATVINNKKAAEQAFNFFVTAVPVKQQNVFDVVAEFASCSTSPGVHNCVIDSGLRDALSRAEKDQPMTLREAIGLGLLHGDWPLISARHELGATNQDIKRCYLEGYCQSNIQKLRKLRILPVGFEIAAANSDIDKPWTLNQVINGYYDCSANGKADPAHPFCHLIDPNWILRAPVARCEAQVYGNTLLSSDSPNRRQECADISTCLLEGSNNECKGVFGYCTQEKNVWRLPGNTCKAEFATCTTYKNTRTNQLVSYLARTVDAGSCDANAAGCRAYSIAKKSDGSWITSEEGVGLLGMQTVFFNQSIQSFSCTETAEGCSAFLPAIKTDSGYAKPALNTTPVRLKKAPQYLGCYDINSAILGIQYPTTNAQLALLPNTDACKPFAQACIEDEIGCELYTSSDGGPNVPGIVGDFACPASCIGYDTFKQKETAFASAVFPLHFVPGVGLANMNKKGQVCSAQYEGCDQFTNLDAAAAGGEGLEYYTDIKYCERPATDKSNTKTYYSWEGSANSGYALQVHTLRPIAPSEATFLASLPISAEAKQEFSAGAPAYAADDAATLSGYIADCNQTAYNIYLDTGIPGLDGAADSGCRALYDTAGNVFYRLLEHTVSVSAACHPLRKTESNFFVDANIDEPNFCSQKFGNWTNVAGDGSEDLVCQRCVGGGQYQNGACVYWAIDAPNESNSCIPAANGCRAYVGNGGNNIEQIALDGFEPGDGSIDAWGPKNDVSVAAEAVQVNLHSLKIDADSVFRLVSETDLFPAPAGTYELRFWARGAPQNLSIRFEQNNQPVGVFASAETPAAIGSSWKQYTLGPVTFTGDSAKDATLVFARTLVQVGLSDTAYFLDNVELRRFDDVVYLVKNSWKTPQGYDAPAECFAADQKPSDPFPGVALGCRAYTDSKGASVATTGFEQLCRPEAVGCQALYDTQNTAEEGFVFYHARCVAAAGQVCDLVAIDANNAPIQTLGSCTVPSGETGCYVDKIVLPSNAVNIQKIDFSDPSTVFLPPDTPEATPIFLTNAPKYQCDSKNLGCTRFGLESQILPDKTNPASFEFSDVFLINDPKQYTGANGTLCLGENIGCTAFAANNTVQYFKDPQIYGQGLCSYKENISIGGVNRSGWFLDDVGTCSNDSEQFCTADDTCAPNATCQNIGTTACYPNYILPNGSYGAWSNESDNYLGRVAQCGAENNRCTELLDPADTSGGVYPKGKSYHVIFDEKITADVADCGEGASLKEGCVLFDKTDNPNKLFSSEKLETLGELANPKYGFVPLNKLSADNAVDNDANLLLKVGRDRQCTEWLSCKTKKTEISESGEKVSVCLEVDLCAMADAAGNCIHWVEKNPSAQHQIFSEEAYIQRDVSWHGVDYTGYSMRNKYPINTFVNLGFSDQASTFLVHRVEDILLGNPGDLNYVGCIGDFEENTEGKICGLDGKGRCFLNRCTYPIDGVYHSSVPDISTANVKDIVSSAKEVGDFQDALCKVHPEQDSPFSSSVAANGQPKTLGDRFEYQSLKPGFKGVHICQEGSCQCSYQKVKYKNNVTDYWDKGKIISAGVCVGGKQDGYTCDPAASICEEGECTRITELSTLAGMESFCLEYDDSRPGNCITWMPIDLNTSGVDSYNNFAQAGYSPIIDAENGGELFCLNSSGNKTYDDIMWSGEFSSFGLEQYEKSFGFKIASNAIGHYSDEYSIDYILYPKTTDGIVPIFDSNLDYVSKLYGVASLWGWHELDKPTSIVGRIANLWRWALYNKNVYNKFNETDLLLIGDSTSYEVDTPIFTNDVNRMYFAPLILPDTDSAFFKGAYIDFDELRNKSTQKNIGEDITIVHRSIGSAFLEEFLVWKLADKTKDKLPHLAELVDSKNYEGIKSIVNKYNLKDKDTVTLEKGDYGTDKTDEEVEVTFASKDIPYTTYVGGTDVATGYEVFPFRITNADWGKTEKTNACNGVTYGIFIPLKDYESDAKAEKDMPLITDIIKQHKNLFTTALLPYQGGMEYIAFFIPVDEANPLCGSDKDLILNQNKSFDHSWWVAHLADETEEWATDCNPFLSYVDEKNNIVQCSQFIVPQGSGNKSKMNTNKYGYHFFSDTNASPAYGPALGYILDMRSQCTDYVQIYDDTKHGTKESTDKAWTNRLWSLANELSVSTFLKNIGKATAIVPYGSINLKGSDILNLDKKYNFDSYGADGIPYRCADPAFVGGSFSLTTDKGGNVLCSSLEAKGYPQDKMVSISNNENANDDIIELFAKSFLRKSRNKSSGNWQLLETKKTTISQASDVEFSEVYDLAGNIDNSGIPPQIYGLNPATCFLGSTVCTAAEKNTITINQRNGTLTDYDRDPAELPDEDINLDGHPDALVGIAGQLLINANFFAFADDNHMPIRRILLDWGDETSILNDQQYGRYKNRKPYCGTDDGIHSRCEGTKLPQLTCVTKNDCLNEDGANELCVGAGTVGAFGDTNRACQEGYFEFQHTYLCRDSTPEVNTRNEKIKFAVSELPTATQNRLKNTYNLSDTDVVCAFTPRVQALDNWGWCNGECVDPFTGNKFVNGGCYNYETAGVQNGIDQCRSKESEPWTKYQGTIIVVPKK